MKNEIDKKYIKQIKKQFDSAINEFAEEMTFQIESAYESAIEQFYDDYLPKYYQRTYSTYLASNRANDMFGFYHRGNVYESGIYVDPMFIPGKPYRADTDWVFNRTFVEGIHGFTAYEIQQREKLDAMVDFLMSREKKTWKKTRKLQKKSSSIKKAPTKMRYTYAGMFKFQKDDSIDNNLEDSVKAITYKGRATTPRKIMDKSFKKITKKKNLEAIQRKFFDKYFAGE